MSIMQMMNPAIQSLIIVFYFSTFLTRKSSKTPQIVMFSIFGVLVFLARIATNFILSDFLFIPYLRNLIYISELYIISRLFFQKSAGVQIYLSVSFYTITHLCNFFADLFSSPFNRYLESYLAKNINSGEYSTQSLQNQIDVFGKVSYSIHLLFVSLLIVVILFFITKIYTYKSYPLAWQECLILLLPCLAAWAITEIFYQLMAQPDGYLMVEIHSWLLPLATLILLFNILVTVLLFQKQIQKHLEEKNMMALEIAVEQVQEQVQAVQNVYADIRGLRHDMQGHLTNIALLMQKQDSPETQHEVGEYLAKLEQSIDCLDFSSTTGNAVTDVLLYQKQAFAQKLGISFKSDFIFPNDLKFDAFDMAVVLGNALDNAIEACTAMLDSKGNNIIPFIYLHTFQKGEILFIEIENSFSGKLLLNKQTGLPQSNKIDVQSHGFGLINIQQCAKKYDGELSITTKKKDGVNIFRLFIIMQENETG